MYRSGWPQEYSRTRIHRGRYLIQLWRKGGTRFLYLIITLVLQVYVSTQYGGGNIPDHTLNRRWVRLLMGVHGVSRGGIFGHGAGGRDSGNCGL